MNRVADPIKKARLSFVVWNSLTVALVLLPLSISHFVIDTRDLNRVVINRDFGNAPPHTLTDAERLYINEEVAELKSASIANLLFFDFGILGTNALLMYFLSEWFLKPVSESINREKEFVSNASHELRTPIASISMGSEVALRSKTKTMPMLESSLKMVGSEAKYAGRMIEELLELSRMNSGTLILKKDKISLNAIIEKITEEIKPIAAERNIQVTSAGMENTVSILGDFHKLRLMIQNVVENAVKYSKPESKVEISLIAGVTPTISIKDSGIGMNQEDRAHIFDKFHRGTAAREMAEGSGLGLSIAKWIADNSGVYISVDSIEGKGTTIAFVFKH